jgi:hypothetical protein
MRLGSLSVGTLPWALLLVMSYLLYVSKESRSEEMMVTSRQKHLDFGNLLKELDVWDGMKARFAMI